METKKILKYDNRLIGFILGIIVPVITFILFYLYRKPKSFEIFYNQVLTVNVISKLVSLCVIPNLLIFFIFIWTNRNKSAYGVIGSTFIYAIVVLILTQL
jgi:hypothetical protein